MPLEVLERVMASAIRRADAPEALGGDARGFLRRSGVRGRDLTALATPRAAGRLLVYRSLVHARFRGAIEATLPLTAVRLGAERLDADVAAFLEEGASRSPYLRDLAVEIVEWALPRWAAAPEIPGYLTDLARYELLRIEVGSAPDDGPRAVTPDLSLEARLVFQGAATVARYRHPVQRAPEDPLDPGDTALLLYRDPALAVRCLELTPLAAEILERLLRDQAPLGSAVIAGCAAAGVDLDDTVLAGTTALLTDLAERGVLLGAAP